jgi:8-oxo-dGTP pyrophosphatase MutT (NUDIX family)
MRKEKVLLNACLCFPVRGSKVLLGIKKDNIGKDCWNGWGGGIHQGETPLQAIVRETKEEAKLKTSPDAFEKMAIMYVHNAKAKGGVFVCKVHVFLLYRWEGVFKSTKEITDPTWFPKKELPLRQMMPADPHWLRIVLAGRKIIGTAHYGPFQKTLIGEVKFRFVDSFPEDQPAF